MTEPLATLLRLNLAAAVAVLAVLALRGPVRRLFGAQAAYGLWALVPLTAAAVLLPARTLVVHAPRLPVTPAVDAIFAAPAAAGASAPAGPPVAALLVMIWIAGAAVSLALLVRRQAAFGRALKAGRAGPAVVGVLKPRIVVPDDFEDRYSPREQSLVLAHERTHVARQDSRANAAVALARCLAWFNPLVHLLAHYLRVDQELACDARVVAAHPKARRAYAEAMLKAQLAARPLPLGCYWPAASAHPLAQRIGLLSRPTPGLVRRTSGAVAVAALGLAAAISAWTARPPRLMMVEAPAAAAPARLPPRPVAPAAKPQPAEPLELDAAEVVQAPATEPAATPQTAPTAATPEPAPIEDRRFRPFVRGASERSQVEPGYAVRVVATLTDPEGRHPVTDLTAFGSQSLYRSGYVWRDGSRYQLFTSVEQEGERLTVTASLGDRFWPGRTGSVTLASGETGQIALENGQAITVRATLRRETPEEMQRGSQAAERFERVRYRLTPDPFRCGARGAVC